MKRLDKTKSSVKDEESLLGQPCWLNKCVSQVISKLKRNHSVDVNRNINGLRIIESLLYTFVCRMKNCYPLGKDYMSFISSVQWIYDKLMNYNISEQMEYVKYYTTLLAWQQVRSERDPPDRPEFVNPDDRFLIGYLRRFVGIAKARKDLTIFLSLINAKRFWFKPPASKVLSTLTSHSKTMSTENTIPPHVFILEEIHNVVKEMFTIEDIPFTSFTPSQSACLQAGRANNGNLSLFEDFNVKKAQKEVGKVEMDGYRYTKWYPLLPQQLMALFNEHRETEHKDKFPEAKKGCERKQVKIALVYEPGGKIRILGVEDGYYSSYIQPLQGALLYAWKRYYPSTMVEDVDPKLINLFSDEFSSSQDYFCSGDYSKATDDIKRRLSAEALKACLMALDDRFDHPIVSTWEFLPPNADPGDREVIDAEGVDFVVRNEASDLISIMEHVEEFVSSELHYPSSVEVDDYALDDFEKQNPTKKKVQRKNIKTEIKPVIQMNGQRMGNRKSFPILCIVNTACYRAACRLYVNELKIPEIEKLIRLREYYKHVLINGDDILFKCSLRLYEIWKEMVKSVGWTLSPGKNYLCQGFAQINSRNYIIKRNKNPVYNVGNDAIMYSDIKRVGYLNLKLVTGFNIKGNGISDADPECLGPNLNEMVRYCPWSAPAIPKCLIRFNERQKYSFKPNWYLPPHLGGYGIDPTFCEGDRIGISYEQRKVAALLITNLREHLTVKKEYGEYTWEKMDNSLRLYQPPIKIASINDYIDPELYIEDFSSITGRLTMIHQWANAGQPFSQDFKKVHLNNANKWASIKGLSIKKIFEYWEPRYYCMKIEGLPPLTPVGPWKQRPLIPSQVNDFPLYAKYLEDLSRRFKDESDDLYLIDNKEFMNKYGFKQSEYLDSVLKYYANFFGVKSKVADVVHFDPVESEKFYRCLLFARPEALFKQDEVEDDFLIPPTLPRNPVPPSVVERQTQAFLNELPHFDDEFVHEHIVHHVPYKHDNAIDELDGPPCDENNPFC